MTWVRLDDRAPTHPKVLSVGPSAAWLWVCGLAHCNAHHTDGRIAKTALSSLYPSDEWSKADARRASERLVSAGLWVDAGDAWLVHDYAQYQAEALREAVEERRADANERKRRERERKRIARLGDESRCDVPRTSADVVRGTSAPTSVGHDAPEGPVSQAPAPSRPVPSRPTEREGVDAPAPAAPPVPPAQLTLVPSGGAPANTQAPEAPQAAPAAPAKARPTPAPERAESAALRAAVGRLAEGYGHDVAPTASRAHWAEGARKVAGLVRGGAELGTAAERVGRAALEWLRAGRSTSFGYALQDCTIGGAARERDVRRGYVGSLPAEAYAAGRELTPEEVFGPAPGEVRHG